MTGSRGSKVRAMSDSMAFLAGVAFAGIAAILLLKGDSNPSILSNTLPPPPALIQPSASPTALPPNGQILPGWNPEQQRSELEQLKAQLDRQRLDTELLKEQLKSQQLLIESLNKECKLNPANPPLNPAPTQANSQQPANQIFWGLLWALAGTLLTILLALVFLVMFLLFGQQRFPRTVQIIHPHSSEPFPPYRRGSEFLPPRIKDRRVDPNDYQE